MSAPVSDRSWPVRAGADTSRRHLFARLAGYPVAGALAAARAAFGGGAERRRRATARIRNALLTVALVLAWLLVPIGALSFLHGGGPAPACRHCYGSPTYRSPTSCAQRARTRAEAVPPLISALLDRGLRALWIIGAALLLAWIWEVDVSSMSNDTTLSRLLRGALHARRDRAGGRTGLACPADLDRPQAGGSASNGRGRHAGGQSARRARCAPCCRSLRNVLLVVLVVMAALMALSALGIEVGPLIAGAGVVGVADRLRLADPGQGRHLGHVLPARRRLPGRRVHRERQHPRHRRGFLAALDQAAAPSRLPAHRAVRLAGEDHQLFAATG